MDRLPPIVDKPPQEVRVKNWPPRPSPAADYFRALERRYKEFQDAAEENQKNQMAVMRYYTSAGDEIRIANVSRYLNEETILLQGEDGDQNPCDVVVQPQNAQVVLKLIVLDESESEQPASKSSPVNFNVYGRP